MHINLRPVLFAATITLSFTAGLWTRPDALQATTSPSGASETGAASHAPRFGHRNSSPRRMRSWYQLPAAAAAPTDPIVLVRLGVPLKDIFKQQKRDEDWAPVMEVHLRDELLALFKALVPEVEQFKVECKESACRVEFTVPAAKENDAFTLQQFLPLGEIMQPWTEELEGGKHIQVGMLLLYGRDWRPLESMKTRYQADFRKRFPDGIESIRRYVAENGLDKEPAR